MHPAQPQPQPLPDFLVFTLLRMIRKTMSEMIISNTIDMMFSASQAT